MLNWESATPELTWHDMLRVWETLATGNTQTWHQPSSTLATFFIWMGIRTKSHLRWRTQLIFTFSPSNFHLCTWSKGLHCRAQWKAIGFTYSTFDYVFYSRDHCVLRKMYLGKILRFINNPMGWCECHAVYSDVGHGMYILQLHPPIIAPPTKTLLAASRLLTSSQSKSSQLESPSLSKRCANKTNTPLFTFVYLCFISIIRICI